MHRDSDTTIMERNPPARRRRVFNIVPYCIAIIVIALLGVMVMALGAAGRVKKPDVMKVAHSPILPELRVIVPQPPVSVRFQHMIFRIGDLEIFRFTYEEGETDDMREVGHE